jgi:hypothetical protein
MIRLSDEQWERIRKHFPEEHIADDRPGRKPVPTRRVLEAVLWIFNTGAQWHMLPQSYPNYKTVHRRFQTWCSNEVLRCGLTPWDFLLLKRKLSNGLASHRISMTGAPVRPIPIDNRWRDSDANNLRPLRIDLFVAVAGRD